MESKAFVIVAVGTGKEMDTLVTASKAGILIEVLGQIGAVIIQIILDFSGISHLPAAVGANLYNRNQTVAYRANRHSAHLIKEYVTRELRHVQTPIYK